MRRRPGYSAGSIDRRLDMKKDKDWTAKIAETVTADFTPLAYTASEEPIVARTEAGVIKRMRLGDGLAKILGGDFPGDDKLSGDQRLELWQLALRVRKADGPVELTEDEVHLMMARVKRWAPVSWIGLLMPVFEDLSRRLTEKGEG